MIETQTIDIRHVQKILSYCPNYDSIINYDYSEGDVLSSKLIEWYKELIFSADGDSPAQLKIIEEVDKSLALYVKDNKYKRGLKKLFNVDDITLNDQNLIKETIKKIILFTNSYEKKEVLEVSNSMWL